MMGCCTFVQVFVVLYFAKKSRADQRRSGRELGRVVKYLSPSISPVLVWIERRLEEGRRENIRDS